MDPATIHIKRPAEPEQMEIYWISNAHGISKMNRRHQHLDSAMRMGFSNGELRADFSNWIQKFSNAHKIDYIEISSRTEAETYRSSNGIREHGFSKIQRYTWMQHRIGEQFSNGARADT